MCLLLSVMEVGDKFTRPEPGAGPEYVKDLSL
jgi:hypothetical protein